MLANEANIEDSTGSPGTGWTSTRTATVWTPVDRMMFGGSTNFAGLNGSRRVLRRTVAR